MIKKFHLTVTLIMLIMAFDITTCFADNPIVQTLYTADPAPMVYEDTCYLYTTHVECCVLLYHKDYKVGEKGKKVTVEVGMNK